MRMSLTITSGGPAAIASSADSALCAKATANPSWLKTSHSSSHVTRSSSTTVIRARLRAMGHPGQRNAQAEPRAAGRGGIDVDRAPVLGQDLARDRETEAGAGRLGGPQRLEQVVHRVGRQTGAAILNDHFDEAPGLGHA